jgi:hypothetical protein
MSNAIRILNKNFIQFATKDSANYLQHVTISVTSIQHISWPMNTQINIYLDNKRFELLYNTPSNANADHTLLTNLLATSIVKPVRWDMPMPDLMMNIDIDTDLDCLKPNSIIVYKKTDDKLS